MTLMTLVRKATDTTLPTGLRVRSLMQCVELFCPLGFHATVDHLASSVGVTRGRWTSENVNDAIDLLVEEWRRHVQFDEQWADRRRALKRIGHRNVTRLERAECEAMPWLTWPREKIRNRRTVRLAGAPADALPFRPVQRDDFETVQVLMPGSVLASSRGFDVRVEGDWLRLPTRIYNGEPDAASLAVLSESQQLMMHCLYTRHHDGHVRQRHLQPLLVADEKWVVPYVVALIGEYVVEIIEDIDAGLADLGRRASKQRSLFGRFARDNFAFIELTRQRVWSYWSAYHRHDYARPGQGDASLPVHPGFTLISALEVAMRDRL